MPEHAPRLHHWVVSKTNNDYNFSNCPVFVSLLCYCHFPVNTSDVLTIESEIENRFVLEQLWPSGFPHHPVWLGMYFNSDSKNLSLYHTYQMFTVTCTHFH